MLQVLNQRWVANTGLVGGSASIIAAVAYFFNVLRNPSILIGLYVAIRTGHDPSGSLAQVIGAAIGIVGALVVFGLMAYFGKPSSVPQAPS